jgi:hypothetical protein
MVIVKADKDSCEKMPSEKLLADMEVQRKAANADVMLAGRPALQFEGQRVRFSGSQRTVTDGLLRKRRSSSPGSGCGK